MPELPEVETIRRVFDRVLTGKRIVEAEVAPDQIVLQGAEPENLEARLEGADVSGTGRKGKYWWIDLGPRGILFGHLGMAGWVREIGAPTIRIREHGNAPLDDENGRPKFLKLRLKADDGRVVVMTDGRRLSRLWTGDTVQSDMKIAALGNDVWTELPNVDVLHGLIAKRKAPLKAILLDQSLFAGVGNWIADEALYQAGIAPKRLGVTLSLKEVELLREKLWSIVDLAVAVGADKEQLPDDWIFHARWGGGKGGDLFRGEPLLREQVGGRTTAWVPTRQK